MTRINTNVASLIGRNTLGRSNASLNEALTRLSTGLRINTGKDDPAGLIASENLRSDITSIRKAISNTDRANQVIATADSALGQVSSLLNDIRGLVTESANAGALSEEQISANQLQVDSSLEALNRIAQTTTFQGRKLLDGSLDFITNSTANFGRLSDLKIDQANLGASGVASVDINVTAAATKAQVNVANIPTSVTPVAATGVITFADEQLTASGSVSFSVAQRESTGTLTLTNGAIEITTTSDGAAAGAQGATGSGVDIVLVDNDDDSGNIATAVYDSGTNTITVNGDFNNAAAGNPGATVQEVADAIGAIQTVGSVNDFTIGTVTTGTGVTVGGDAGTDSNTLTGGLAASTTESIAITATAGADSNISITFIEQAGVGTTPAVSGNATDGYTIAVDSGNTETSVSDIATAIQSISEVATATTASTRSFNGSLDNTPAALTNLTGGRDAGDDVITVSATKSGPNLNRNLLFNTTNTNAGQIAVADDGTNITVSIDATSQYQLADIATAIGDQLGDFTAELTSTAGSGTYEADVTTDDTGPSTSNIAGGIASSGGLNKDAVIEIAGLSGAEVFNLKAGTNLNELINQVNLVSDATGVSATANGTTLELRSTEYGTNAFVDLKVVEEADGGVFKTAIGTGSRDAGEDVIATVNGIAATGNGNELSINTATLDLTANVEADYLGLIEFDITGGGALFQLGPDVVSNQQARLGVTSVNTARLGGVSGKLFQLGSGGSADLTADPNGAAKIVAEAIDQVTSLRGRLGAFQRTTLETNKNALNDTLVNLTEAESSIRDADFAVESAKLTRAQILVQSGTNVLGIANQNPQNVLALLR
ncbi:MAG: flagellin [Planctomycetes bacterium]|nr:flagellin [Planctomycetota bacterium]